jgi:DNA-binding protein HU-beta
MPQEDIKMTKAEFIKQLADKKGSTQKDAAEFLKAFEDVAKDTLKSGDDITLIGFIKIFTKDVKERVHKNPKTGEEVIKPAHKVAKAKVSKNILE